MRWTPNALSMNKPWLQVCWRSVIVLPPPPAFCNERKWKEKINKQTCCGEIVFDGDGKLAGGEITEGLWPACQGGVLCTSGPHQGKT